MTDRVAAGSRACRGHGIGGVADGFRRYKPVDSAEKARGDMNLVGNETGHQTGRFEHSPKNIIMAIQFAWTTVAEVSEPSRSRLNRLLQLLRRGIRVTQ